MKQVLRAIFSRSGGEVINKRSPNQHPIGRQIAAQPTQPRYDRKFHSQGCVQGFQVG